MKMAQVIGARVRIFDNVRYFLNIQMFDVRMFFNFFLKPMLACSNVRRT